MVLQKVPASSPHKSAWDERIQRYAEAFPDAYVVDLPSAVRQIANRDTMLDAVVRVGEHLAAVRAPRQIVATAGTEEEVKAQVEAAGLHLPLLAKSLLADGSSDSHKVAIIHDLEGLSCVVRGDVQGLRPPCIVQEYVNHGGFLFKVYVVGDAVTMTTRKSLPDLRGAKRSNRRRAEARAKAARAAKANVVKEEAAGAEGGAGGVHGAHADGAAAGAGAGASKSKKGGGGGGDGGGGEDGDVDDSGGEDGQESEDDDAGWYATGLQSVPRVSCFKGGATDNETSWRDRVNTGDAHTGLREVMERMQTTHLRGGDVAVDAERERGEGSASTGQGVVGAAVGGDRDTPTGGRDESDLHYVKHRALSGLLAKNLTVSRVGSVDSIADSMSDLNDLSASGGGGGSSDGGAATGEEQRERKRSLGRVGLPPLPPGTLLRSSGGSGAVINRVRSLGTDDSEGGGGPSSGGEGGGDATDDGIKVMQEQSPHFKPDEKSKPPELQEEAIPPPSDAFVRELALALRDKLRLRLFNFDLIRVNGNGDEFLVVDINYFPGIAKMPGYSDTFCNFLKSAKGKTGSQL